VSGYTSISIPAISTGIFNFPKDLCAKLSFDTVLQYFEENPKSSLVEVRFVNFDDKTVEIFEKEFTARFGDTSDKMQEMSEEDLLKFAIDQSKLNGEISSSFETSSALKKEFKVKENQSIQLCIGDITLEDTDVIVNAANSRLDHGGAVALALSNKAGSSMQQVCTDYIKQNGELNISQVFVSTAGNLQCKALAHTVGPMYGGGTNNDVEYSQLVLAVLNCLWAIEKLGFKSIVFPAISTGKFGFPRDACGSLMFRAAKWFFETYPNTCIEKIRFTVYDDDTLGIFDKIFRQVFDQNIQDKGFDRAMQFITDK
jgi:O-acetyl-ADP-ribose deacetylase (regulator of RNase III)